MRKLRKNIQITIAVSACAFAPRREAPNRTKEWTLACPKTSFRTYSDLNERTRKLLQPQNVPGERSVPVYSGFKDTSQIFLKDYVGLNP
jgi:hypothetical protein